MEESKELQGVYQVFRVAIYVSVLVEFFMYAVSPEVLSAWNGVVGDLHDRMKVWMIYRDGNLIYSKLVTVFLVCVTCVGTRNKKQLEMDGRRAVLYPLLAGAALLALAVICYGWGVASLAHAWLWAYMACSLVGTVLVHVALDNVSKFLKEGLGKDRFNLENESFAQCTERVENKYSVNIPMRFYYRGKFRKGWINVENPFRGSWVVGTPGSGKTFSVIEPFIRQHAAKGFALVVYDYKFPTLATKESYWIFHKDGDDFDLKVSDPKRPGYLLIANDPEMESIIGALNALILNRLVTRVNTGQGRNVPVSIIVDELPTLYFHKIDRLIGTARSNKVSVTLGFQELPQLEADYGKVGMQKIITTVGNVVSGSARSKETLEWLSNDIFGKVVQLKRGMTIDRDRTSINLNENMDNLVPASKISDLPTGWICGQVARDYVDTKTGRGGTMNIQESEEFKTSKFFCKTNFDMAEIKEEEKGYVPLPKCYTFGSKEERERILYRNFVEVNQDVKEMVRVVQRRDWAR